MSRQNEHQGALGRFVGLRTLAVVAGFTGCAGILLAKRASAEPLARCALIGFPRAEVAGQGDMIRCRHLLLAATLCQARQPVTAQRQQREENSH